MANQQSHRHESSLSNKEYEAVILGAVLRFPENLPLLTDRLSPEDFHNRRHKAIVLAIQSLLKKEAPIDPFTISTETKNLGEDVLSSEIIELVDNYIDGVDLNYYTGELQTLTKRRKLERLLIDGVGKVQDRGLDYDQIEETVVKDVISIVEREPAPEIEEPRPDEFPRETIKGLSREYADLYSGYLESPWSFWAFSFLTCLGSVVSDRLTLESALKPQPRLFTILLGQSADDRKSEAIKQTDLFFYDALGVDFKPCYGVGSAEGLGERFKAGPKVCLIFDEFKVFQQKANIQGSILLPIINTLFESNRYHSTTKQHSIEIDDGHLCLLGASTIDTFQKMWTETFTDIGFINRLWLCPDRGTKRIAIPSPIPEKKRDELKQRLRDMVAAIGPGPTTLKITPEAFDIFNGWYLGTPRSIFTKRLDTYGHRLLVLFCANENKMIVTADIAERVVKLLQWQLKVREENDVIDAEGKIARMEETIRRTIKKNFNGITRRDLQRVTNYNKYGIFIFNSAVRNLIEEGEIYYSTKIKAFKPKMS